MQIKKVPISVKSHAVTLASTRLAGAQAAFAKMRASTTQIELKIAWGDFLSNSQAVFDILEKGAGKEGKSAGWYGKKKGERKRDPLLLYLHHARSAVLHGLEDDSFSFHSNPTPVYPPALVDEMDTMLIVADPLSPQGLCMEFKLKDGSRYVPSQKYYRPTMVLGTVRNGRAGGAFEPPKSHLGRPLDDTSVTGIAALGLTYVANLVAEAEQLAVITRGG